MNPKGIILTGGPNSCYEPDSPTYTKELFELGIPVLGLCYGAQLMMHVLGGKVEKAPVREYGKTEVFVKQDSPLFAGVSATTICWMSHFDYISKAGRGIPHLRTYGRLPGCSSRETGKEFICDPVPSGSTAYGWEPRCCTTLYAVSVDAPEHGAWILLLKMPSRT